MVEITLVFTGAGPDNGPVNRPAECCHDYRDGMTLIQTGQIRREEWER